jgi:hypothetical protein
MKDEKIAQAIITTALILKLNVKISDFTVNLKAVP